MTGAQEASAPSKPDRAAGESTGHGDDVLANSLDVLAGRVRELEGALKELIDECLFQGDSRKPRPALARADAVLWMRDRGTGPAPHDEVASRCSRVGEEDAR